MKMLIIIPAHNEEMNIAKTIQDIRSKCPGEEFIVINDGSTDGTEAVCSACGCPVLSLPVNLGLAGAVQTGMRYAVKAGYEYVLQFDGDGQHDASYIYAMLDRMKETDADIVIGSRFCGRKKPFSMRMIGSRVISFAVKLTTGEKISDPTSGMRIYNRKMAEKFSKEINFGPEPDTLALLMRNGARIEEEQVTMRERTAGTSYLTAGKSIKYMLNMCISILFIQFFRRVE